MVAPAILYRMRSLWIPADEPLWPTVTKEDIQTHFKDGSGTIREIKLMNGFGFIEYDDAMDARDVVPGKTSTNHIDCY